MYLTDWTCRVTWLSEANGLFSLQRGALFFDTESNMLRPSPRNGIFPVVKSLWITGELLGTQQDGQVVLYPVGDGCCESISADASGKGGLY